MHGYNNHVLEMARIDVGSEDPILLQESVVIHDHLVFKEIWIPLLITVIKCMIQFRARNSILRIYGQI